jgi:hypothetical protein
LKKISETDFFIVQYQIVDCWEDYRNRKTKTGQNLKVENKKTGQRIRKNIEKTGQMMYRIVGGKVLCIEKILL